MPIKIIFSVRAFNNEEFEHVGITNEKSLNELANLYNVSVQKFKKGEFKLNLPTKSEIENLNLNKELKNKIGPYAKQTIYVRNPDPQSLKSFSTWETLNPDLK